jgi:hypothetical protein
MKKLIFSLCIVASLLIANDSQAQRLRFYYYPDRNVYYDPGHSQYIYDNNGNWTTVRTLPSGYVVRNSPRVTIYSDRPEVWTYNEEHRTKYKNYHYPKAKNKHREKEEHEHDK